MVTSMLMEPPPHIGSITMSPLFTEAILRQWRRGAHATTLLVLTSVARRQWWLAELWDQNRKCFF